MQKTNKNERIKTIVFFGSLVHFFRIKIVIQDKSPNLTFTSSDITEFKFIKFSSFLSHPRSTKQNAVLYGFLIFLRVNTDKKNLNSLCSRLPVNSPSMQIKEDLLIDSSISGSRLLKLCFVTSIFRLKTIIPIIILIYIYEFYS